jgi:hypothetical protein
MARIIIRPRYFRDLRQHTSEWLGASNDLLEHRGTFTNSGERTPPFETNVSITPLLEI